MKLFKTGLSKSTNVLVLSPPKRTIEVRPKLASAITIYKPCTQNICSSAEAVPIAKH